MKSFHRIVVVEELLFLRTEPILWVPHYKMGGILVFVGIAMTANAPYIYDWHRREYYE
ncbi:hypothetical protein [Shewanella ulleungensis]|uniref:Uncharacterized protein n=1 Tax=Shewanella ulleungensis TaxID=2282699 RepID=A0ABQ2QEL9_9GAMM|nr:hypothetical protein [Shewanella ulleungensis]MCL1148528.1 hypothetical protein [Shewanella ulleungensis]GGP77350.1 hypothetical protein GCM10009410_07400 [Shewanella ulleungensis]